MVCNWSPDPPRDVDDGVSMPSQNIVVESDESEDETLGNAPPGYELLPQGPAIGLSSDEVPHVECIANMNEGECVECMEWAYEEEQSENEASSNSATSAIDAPSTSDGLGARRMSEVAEVDRLYSMPELRPELTVDCDEVRAAMSGFSLPPSAFPSWAVDVPESQWASTLAQQIQRIQTNTSTTDK